MEVFILICSCVALLPTIIHGNDQLCEQLEKMAARNESINGIFQPAQRGFMGKGAFSVTFKGTLLKPIKREVAMKFTPVEEGYMADKEYEAYTYLNAINNTDVERYGIAAVFYYGKWENYIMIAITLLDSEFRKRGVEHKLTDVDILIITREFVRISKYIHSRGVHHSDVKLDNIMFRKHQGFLIDFNTATRLHRVDANFQMEEVYEDRRRFAKEDWACFLYSILEYIGVKFEWFDYSALYKLLYGEMGNNLNLKLKADIEKIDEIENKSFRRVFKEMAISAFKGEVNLWANNSKRKLDDFLETTKFPLYDKLYQIITEEIDKLKLPKPVLVSWLTDEEKNKAKNEIKRLPDISTIKDRFLNVNAEYPKVNYNYFAN